jgi:hypothetical protein
MPHLSDSEDIEVINFQELESDYAAPNTGFVRLFFKAAGAFFRRSTGAAIRLLTESDLANLTFPVASIIKGRWSGSSQTDRVFLQTDETNQSTSVGVKPNGTATSSSWSAYGESTPTNSSLGVFGSNATYGAFINSTAAGSGTAKPFGLLLAGVLKFFLDTTGYAGFNTNAPTAQVDINSDILRLRVAKTPASAGATGNQGDWCWDTNYLYICVANNTWKRIALASW